MTPRLRSLFDGTVEPLLEALPVWGSLFLYFEREIEASIKRYEARRLLRRYPPPPPPRYSPMSEEAAAKLKADSALAMRPDVAAAVAELEAPIISTKEQGHDEKGPAASALVAASSSSALGASGEQQPSVSWISDLSLEHADLGTTVLGFLDSKSALPGIGTSSPALRAAVKADLPHLRLVNHYDYREPKPAILPKLEEFVRLRHLSITTYAVREATVWVARVVELGLPARLESFALSVRGTQLITSLFSAQWPQLRSLDLAQEQLLPFIRAARRQHLVFPSLQSLGFSFLTDKVTRKLLRLLDRGAFPALTRLTTSNLDYGPALALEPDSKEETERACELLLRLPGTDGLFLGTMYQPLLADDTWAPFSSLLHTGGLVDLT